MALKHYVEAVIIYKWWDINGFLLHLAFDFEDEMEVFHSRNLQHICVPTSLLSLSIYFEILYASVIFWNSEQ